MEDYSVSAIIPAYNAGKYICRAIDSVLAQTLPVNEIIVVDDGSTDDTAQKVRAYGDKVRLIQKENGGAGSARNVGIREAKFTWLSFLDSDDEWLEAKNEYQIELIKRNPDVCWVSSNFYRCLCNSGVIQENQTSEAIAILLKGEECYKDFFDAFLAKQYGCMDTMMVKREVFTTVGVFSEVQAHMEDMDFWWRAAMYYPKIGFVNVPLATYHLDIEGSLMHVKKKWGEYVLMIERAIRLAEDNDRLAKFRPCLVSELHGRIRSMLFNKDNAVEIKIILNKFNYLFGWKYKSVVMFLLIFPGLTELVVKIISGIKSVSGKNKELKRDYRTIN